MKNTRISIGARAAGRNFRLLYIPHGIAHGCQGLEDEIGISCRMSTLYRPEAVAGLRWDDPALADRRPKQATAIAEPDLSRPDFPLS